MQSRKGAEYIKSKTYAAFRKGDGFASAFA